MAKNPAASETQPTTPEPARPATVQWIDKNMATHFANVVNVQSTREQVDLFFGTNQTWNVAGNSQVAVDLANRIILTPLPPSGFGPCSAAYCENTNRDTARSTSSDRRNVTAGTRSQHPLGDPASAGAVGASETNKTQRDSKAADDGSPAGAAVASLEPALWKRLNDAGEPCRRGAGLACAAVSDDQWRESRDSASGGEAPNSFDATAFWPEGSGRAPALAEVAELALRERRGVASGDNAEATESSGIQHVAVPILLGAELEGAVAVTLRSGRAEDSRQALRQLQWGTAWIRERLHQAHGAEQEQLLDRTRTALNLARRRARS